MLFDLSLSLLHAGNGLRAVAKVDSTDELANDDDGRALGDVCLERRVGDEGRGGEEGGTDVGVETELLAESEETQLRAKGRVSSPFRTSDSACEKDRKLEPQFRGKSQAPPRRMASAALQAARVDSGRGFWWLSMAIPPKSCSSMVKVRSENSERVWRTRTASAVTSGPAVSR